MNTDISAEEWEKRRLVMDEYMDRQTPLRAAWLDKSLPAEVREEAGRKLTALIAEVTAKCPPITGTFTYTDEDVEEAKKHGF